ncbi:hypothetical protein ACERII_18865 [Evansella sp. AB-rgal1]|uniref:hypothetical protein n=1 Tax=Evansella sp. AB-rgal1 TaxID=3242696 RepID=UPI00359E9124
MQSTIIGLLILSILLFVLSIFQKDRGKEVEKQMENLSIQLMQEMYQIKKKVSLLEEELMVNSTNSLENMSLSHGTKLTRDDVLAMYEEGNTIQDIAALTNYSEVEIDELLSQKV